MGFDAQFVSLSLREGIKNTLALRGAGAGLGRRANDLRSLWGRQDRAVVQLTGPNSTREPRKIKNFTPTEAYKKRLAALKGLIDCTSK